ncbi:hypothetical protein KUCAC02_008678 [Chaenocephalus aceratus]|uniref:Uncharacterized protein n=1 Tax=Chaenocephalus aceratus TaxID=36190 RepID=A0ACB9WSS8_CHAAC|nr:hypothetical protein KUCAC02_008678 [Chaenocephalus aceratus]
MEGMLTFLWLRLLGRTQCQPADPQLPGEKETEAAGNCREEDTVPSLDSKEISRTDRPKKNTVYILVAPPTALQQSNAVPKYSLPELLVSVLWVSVYPVQPPRAAGLSAVGLCVPSTASQSCWSQCCGSLCTQCWLTELLVSVLWVSVYPVLAH